MKKEIKIILIILVILTLLTLIFFTIDYMKPKMKATVVRVDEHGLLVMDDGLIMLGFTKEGNIGFKQGQEILIYFDGIVMESYPAQLGHVEKIKIIKEKSDTKISDDILRYCYSSFENVNVSINEFTTKGISFDITDKNELKYNYSNDYKIYTKVKNEQYTGIGEKIGEDTQNSTAGYTGTGIEYKWQEVQKNSDISSINTVETTSTSSSSAIKIKIDWTKMYGELKQRRI